MVAVHVVWAVYGALMGAALASYGCVIAERVPRGETLGGRSHCVCGRQLRAVELVPVLGWLACRGCARCCGARLPIGYLVAELLAGVLGGTVAAVGSVLASRGSFWLGVALAVLVLAACLAVTVALRWPRRGAAK